MGSKRRKPMQHIAGYPILGHVINTVCGLAEHAVIGQKFDRIPVIILPPNQPEMEDFIRPHLYAIQKKAQGTGDAALVGLESLGALKEEDVALILYADAPLLRAETLGRLVEKSLQTGFAILGACLPDPTGYGRLVLDRQGYVQKIIEEKDANAEEKKYSLCNAGCYAASAIALKKWLGQCDNKNAAGEYYLPDIVEKAHNDKLEVAMVDADYEEVLGANLRSEMAMLETLWQRKRRMKAMDEEKVTLLDPETVWFSYDTILGRDVVVEPCVFFAPGVTIGEGTRIRAFSRIEGSEIAEESVIGPFSFLRPGTKAEKHAKIGSFVEIKNTSIGIKTKINHLSYIGDTTIGEKVNVGAGVIICNYDGETKHQTVIEDGAFLGSNVSLVAPVTVGEGALIAAGSVIAKNIEANALAIARPLLEQKKNKASLILRRNKEKARKGN